MLSESEIYAFSNLVLLHFSWKYICILNEISIKIFILRFYFSSENSFYYQ